MFKTVTTTTLKNETKSIVDYVESNVDAEVLITTHNKTRAVMVNFEKWENLNKNTKPKKKSVYDKVKHLIVATGKPMDSAAIIRKMRDEE